MVINDKNLFHEAFPEGTVIYDLERGKLPGIRELPWQTDTSIGKNSWSYVSDWDSKDANSLIDDLVDIVSKNGNLLLNVGPRADGIIPDDQKEILLQIGDWLAINGDAIYDTKYWKTYGEGPTKVTGGYMSEHKGDKGFTAQDIRFTQKGDKLYAILLAWPKNGKVVISSLSTTNELAKGLNIKNIELLGSTNTIKYTQSENGLTIEDLGKKSGDFAHVFEITLGTP